MLNKNIAYKVGILREGKEPPDKRVPFSPSQCAKIKQFYPNVSLYVQPSPIRCFPDNAYIAEGIELKEDLSDCDILFGIKEVPVKDLISWKNYFFFSHTHKLQPYNRGLIQAILKKRIRLTDYECLVSPAGNRVLGFGRFAGLVGAYNGFLAYGKKQKLYDLTPANQCTDLEEVLHELKKVKLTKEKIILTGSGRVAKGVIEILTALGLDQVSVQDFLNKQFHKSVYCWIDADEYTANKDGHKFEHQHFFHHGDEYISTFNRFTEVSDIFIAGHFWDPKSPVFFTKKDAVPSKFKIKVIADISCDVASSIPSTIRSSTINDPIYDYDPISEKEVQPFTPDKITVMAVDNLPCELPIDASISFGESLIKEVLPSLLGKGDVDGILKNATLTTQKGKLADKYKYMQDFANGKLKP